MDHEPLVVKIKMSNVKVSWYLHMGQNNFGLGYSSTKSQNGNAFKQKWEF